MIKSSYGTIEWCQPGNNLRRATATLFEDGSLRIGAQMRERIRDRKIRIGLMSSECALVVEVITENGFKLSKTGETKVSIIGNAPKIYGRGMSLVLLQPPCILCRHPIF